MNWDKLKSYKFDHVTVTIYRSIFRKWMVEVEYKDGQVPSQLVFENESEAWRRFYDAAQTALKWEAEAWTATQKN